MRGRSYVQAARDQPPCAWEVDHIFAGYGSANEVDTLFWGARGCRVNIAAHTARKSESCEHSDVDESDSNDAPSIATKSSVRPSLAHRHATTCIRHAAVGPMSVTESS